MKQRADTQDEKLIDSTHVIAQLKQEIKNLKTDLISKFNMKSLDLEDSLVQEVIQKLEFKDLQAKTKPSKSEHSNFENKIKLGHKG